MEPDQEYTIIRVPDGIGGSFGVRVVAADPTLSKQMQDLIEAKRAEELIIAAKKQFEEDVERFRVRTEIQCGDVVALNAIALIRMRNESAMLGLDIVPDGVRWGFDSEDALEFRAGDNLTLDYDGEVLDHGSENDDPLNIFLAKPISAHGKMQITYNRIEAIAEFRKRFPPGHVFYGAHFSSQDHIFHQAVLDRISDDAYYLMMGYKRGEAPEGDNT